jgi:DNA sulfur modification protein DndD
MRLTVIRAANESGKTTILHGLQWALYGHAALPNRGVGFRLHPVDWKATEDKIVLITVTVEFELTTLNPTSEGKTRQRYRLIRSTSEHMDSNFSRPSSTLKLFQITSAGAQKFDHPESFINDELPPELREVFFTDGDRALSFIKADATTSIKRERVQQAIHSLLGLNVINASIKRVKKSASEANKDIKQFHGAGEVNEVATLLEANENRREELENDLEDARLQYRAFSEKYDETEGKISVALEKGNKEELRKDRDRVREEIKQLAKQCETVKKDLSDLLCSRSIAADLLAPVLDRAFDKLGQMYDRGEIPNAMIPVLNDCLESEICVCGVALKPGSLDGEERRVHIQKLIDSSQSADEVKKIITDLYYRQKSQRVEAATSLNTSWLEEYRNVAKRHDGLQDQREIKGRESKGLEKKLDSLPDTDIQGLREAHRIYKDQSDRFLRTAASLENELKHLRMEIQELTEKRKTLLRQQEKGARVQAKLDATQDVLTILDSARKRITNEELQKVSDQMNSLFLEMIGADREQRAIIQCVEISREFDIIVYGPDGRTLDPDRDINGASRRALTLAFILALTKVSAVEAPNVIDTPLGMTSGFVKRSILRTAVRESRQLVLFLTHDEIHGCADIIDETAGVVYTLTNPAHYPKMLINDPGVVEIKAIRCSCDHRNSCKLCKRRLNSED